MRDVLLFVATVATFAALVTVHVALVVGLARRKVGARAGVAVTALLLPPLAVLWGFREGLRLRASLWVVAALVYGGCLAVSWSG